MNVIKTLAVKLVLVTALVLPHQSNAYTYFTQVYQCFGGWVCGEATTTLSPFDLPSVVAAEHAITFTHSDGVDWGWDSGVTSPTTVTPIFTRVLLPLPTTDFDIYFAQTLHVFIEPDANTFDEYSFDELIFW